MAIRFGTVGGGWRSACYLQTARLWAGAAATGMVSRSADKRAALEAEWGVRAFATAAELVDATAPEFLVVAVRGEAALEVILELLDLRVPLLLETPPAATVEGLERLNEAAAKSGARIQVAEQYWLQPMNAARLALAASGLIGEPGYVHASVNHSYHNISLIRKYLGVGFAPAAIRAAAFSAPAVGGPGRLGDPAAEKLTHPEHLVALFDFGGKRGLFDFEADQHRSWIRTPRVLVRGERGEIADERVSYLKDFLTPVYGELKRIATGGDGDFEGCHLKGVMLGDAWLDRNETAPARLADEEIAQARCLLEMRGYLESGRAFYSLAEASQDAYLAMELRRAAAEGRTVETKAQAWAAGK
jgi:predicted dehydrogenase